MAKHKQADQKTASSELFFIQAFIIGNFIIGAYVNIYAVMNVQFSVAELSEFRSVDPQLCIEIRVFVPLIGRLKKVFFRQQCRSFLKEAPVIFSGHTDVNIVIPGNKAIVTHRSESCTIDQKVIYVKLVTYPDDITKCIQFQLMYGFQFVFRIYC